MGGPPGDLVSDTNRAGNALVDAVTPSGVSLDRYGGRLEEAVDRTVSDLDAEGGQRTSMPIGNAILDPSASTR